MKQYTIKRDKRFLDIKRCCLTVEKSLRRLKQDMHDDQAQAIIEPMFRSTIWQQDKLFQLPQTIPLLLAVGAIEQMWSEWSDPDYEVNCRNTIQYSLDILVGRRILVHRIAIGEYKIPIQQESSKEEWYLRFLQIVNVFKQSETIKQHQVIELLDTLNESSPLTISGYLARRMAELLVLVPDLNPWESSPDLGYLNQQELAECVHMKWSPSKISWPTVEHILRMLNKERRFIVEYVCQGWRYISWCICEPSPVYVVEGNPFPGIE